MNEVVIPDLPHELAHDWYGVLTWLIIGFVVAFETWVWYDRKAFRQRLTDIEDDLAELKAVLKVVAGDDAQTHRILAVALRHLRELWTWIHDGHSTPPPSVPTELRDEI